MHEEARADAMAEIRARLWRLERRDWWLWWTAVIVTLLLTVGVGLLSLSPGLQGEELLYLPSLDRAVRGLAGVVVLFNFHAIYQQVLIKRLRRQLAEQLATTAKLEIVAEQMHTLAVLEPLTGLYNRRLAEERLAAETNRSKRHGHALSVLTLDLNDFKLINDGYGHAAGDLVLKEFANRLKCAIRVSDVAARMGGDEFLVLLPECHVGQVDHVLARLRDLEVEFRGQKIPFSFSAGWADYQPGEPIHELLERADQMLYHDKRARNKRVDSIPGTR